MNTISLDGKEYILRCDINVLEQINTKYATPEKLLEKGIEGIKDVTAWMVNEHYYYIGERERVTPEFVGSRLKYAEYSDVCKAVIAELAECMKVKN
jgi:hypothetical protein